jgi:circadian clock protein KaiC
LSIQIAPAPLIQLPTGVPGLDEVLGGGIPEYSCTVIAGGPGTGKTTLAQQILFANASPGRPGVYFTGSGEPRHRLLQHQQHLTFFDTDKLNRCIHVVNLDQHVARGDAARVVEAIASELEDRHASFVVIDLVLALAPAALWNALALYVTRCEATSFLVADFEPLYTPTNPVLSTADAILWLRQSLEGDATLHSVQALKVRGQQPLGGLHALRMTWDGIRVFPRWPTPEPRVLRAYPPARQSVGIAELDGLMGGGVPAGDAVLVEGPSGTGKSVLATQFLVEGGHEGEAGVAFLFEERPDRFIARAEALDLQLERLVQAGLVEVLSFRGRDMSSEELIREMQQAITRVGARRVVIDSTLGLELVISASRGLRDCLWRLLDALTGAGVTVWLNTTPDPARPSLMSLVDVVLKLGRVDHDGRVENRLAVVKMSSSAHSADLRPYAVRERGVQLPPHEHERKNGHVNGYNGLAVNFQSDAHRQ